jgi:MULE transposase domain
VISTIRLLKIAQLCDKLHADATYKLNFQGYPVIIFGVTDQSKKFYVTCICLCSNETTEDLKYMFRSLKDASSRLNIQLNF